MPIKSMAQMRAMYAAAEGRGESDIPKSVAKKFIKETPKKAMKDFGKVMQWTNRWRDEGWNKTLLTYTFANGSTIEFFSAVQEAKLRGARRQVLYINSFFRSFKLNLRVGGAANSQHMKGEAIDIDTRSRDENRILYEWMRDNLKYDQLIWEYGNDDGPDWIHVSFTKNNRQQTIKILKKF